jgi:hypothetical protein
MSTAFKRFMERIIAKYPHLKPRPDEWIHTLSPRRKLQ